MRSIYGYSFWIAIEVDSAILCCRLVCSGGVVERGVKTFTSFSQSDPEILSKQTASERRSKRTLDFWKRNRLRIMFVMYVQSQIYVQMIAVCLQCNQILLIRICAFAFFDILVYVCMNTNVLKLAYILSSR